MRQLAASFMGELWLSGWATIVPSPIPISNMGEFVKGGGWFFGENVLTYRLRQANKKTSRLNVNAASTIEWLTHFISSDLCSGRTDYGPCLRCLKNQMNASSDDPRVNRLATTGALLHREKNSRIDLNFQPSCSR
jgi:hypothetical protein